MRTLVSVAASLVLLAAAAAPASARAPSGKSGKASSAKAYPFPLETHTLPNGVRLVLVSYDSPGLCAFYTLMRVGSRNEPEAGRSGYAHFFEHMMFRGTKNHPAEEYGATMSKLGLDTNAFTSEDMTVYHAFGPSKALPTIIEYEADRFMNLDYDEAQFRTEAGAILGEYAKSASDPGLKFSEKMMETAFTTHTYRHTTLGYLDDVKNMPGGFAYSREFFKRYYTPDNATVIVVGDFDKAATLAQLTKAYSPWQGKLDAAPITQEPPQTTARRAHVDWPMPTLPRIWMAWHSPAATDATATAAQAVLNAYLFGPTSPLYQDLVLGRQLVESIDPTWDPHRDASLFGVESRVRKASDLDVVEKAIVDEIAKLAAGQVDKKRLEAVRSNLTYSTILSLDTANRAAVTLASTAAQTGDLESLNKEFARIAKLQPAELVAFAKKWLTDGNRTTVTLTTAEVKK
jgi:zinc protease